MNQTSNTNDVVQQILKPPLDSYSKVIPNVNINIDELRQKANRIDGKMNPKPDQKVKYAKSNEKLSESDKEKQAYNFQGDFDAFRTENRYIPKIKIHYPIAEKVTEQKLNIRKNNYNGIMTQYQPMKIEIRKSDITAKDTLKTFRVVQDPSLNIRKNNYKHNPIFFTNQYAEFYYSDEGEKVYEDSNLIKNAFESTKKLDLSRSIAQSCDPKSTFFKNYKAVLQREQIIKNLNENNLFENMEEEDEDEDEEKAKKEEDDLQTKKTDKDKDVKIDEKEIKTDEKDIKQISDVELDKNNEGVFNTFYTHHLKKHKEVLDENYKKKGRDIAHGREENSFLNSFLSPINKPISIAENKTVQCCIKDFSMNLGTDNWYPLQVILDEPVHEYVRNQTIALKTPDEKQTINIQIKTLLQQLLDFRIALTKDRPNERNSSTQSNVNKNELKKTILNDRFIEKLKYLTNPLETVYDFNSSGSLNVPLFHTTIKTIKVSYDRLDDLGKLLKENSSNLMIDTLIIDKYYQRDINREKDTNKDISGFFNEHTIYINNFVIENNEYSQKIHDFFIRHIDNFYKTPGNKRLNCSIPIQNLTIKKNNESDKLNLNLLYCLFLEMLYKMLETNNLFPVAFQKLDISNLNCTNIDGLVKIITKFKMIKEINISDAKVDNISLVESPSFLSQIKLVEKREQSWEGLSNKQLMSKIRTEIDTIRLRIKKNEENRNKNENEYDVSKGIDTGFDMSMGVYPILERLYVKTSPDTYRALYDLFKTLKFFQGFTCPDMNHDAIVKDMENYCENIFEMQSFPSDDFEKRI